MSPDADPAARILALEADLLRPEVRASRERLDELLADDFVEFGSSGRRWDKRACIEACLARPAGDYEMDAFELRMLGPEFALATYRLVRKEQGRRTPSLRCSIWCLQAGRWRMLFHQGTPVSS